MKSGKLARGGPVQRAETTSYTSAASSESHYTTMEPLPTGIFNQINMLTAMCNWQHRRAEADEAMDVTKIWLPRRSLLASKKTHLITPRVCIVTTAHDQAGCLRSEAASTALNTMAEPLLRFGPQPRRGKSTQRSSTHRPAIC